jgi:hypothetical protein
MFNMGQNSSMREHWGVGSKDLSAMQVTVSTFNE